MLISDFDYDLPDSLIARQPLADRTSSRLMTVNRKTQEIGECPFSSILDFLSENDVLVLNDTKVIPARLIATKKTGAKIEILLSRALENDWVWEALLKPAKRVREGDVLEIGEGFTCTVLEKNGAMNRLKFAGEGSFYTLLSAHGHVPIPPYISQDLAEADSFIERYQTTFADKPGAVAAPTAGLHFTPELLEQARASGVAIETITLHIGYGTFQPITADEVRNHQMHAERFFISEDTAERLNRYKLENRRIIGVGTTTVRTLETAFQNGQIMAGDGESRLFIYPGIPFRVIDAMITNFHLPQSSLLLLVCALGGQDLMMRAYHSAVAKQFRFFSFGDAMFIY